jgi:hypothetical protein
MLQIVVALMTINREFFGFQAQVTAPFSVEVSMMKAFKVCSH